MASSDSEFANLVPMKILGDGTQPSTSSVLIAPTRSIPKKRSTENPTSSIEDAFNRFANDEISCQAYMEMTGGLLEEEQIDMATLSSFIETESDHDESMGFEHETEGGVLMAGQSSIKKRKAQPATREASSNHNVLADVELPADLRTQLRIDAVSGEFVMLPPSQIIDEDSELISQAGQAQKRKYRRHTNPALEGAIGQANAIAAEGDKEVALQMMREVIRQEPRNPDVYKHIAQIYEDMEDEVSMTKAFEYRLLGAHLYSRTSSIEWNDVGDLALRLNRLEEAAACFGKAIRAEPQNWYNYERRINVLETLKQRSLAMKARLQAAQAVTNMDFTFIKNMIKTVADYYVKSDEEERALEALHTYIVRAREYNQPAEDQKNTHFSMLIDRGRYEDAIRAILALCSGVQALDENSTPIFQINFTPGGYTVKPFPPNKPIKVFHVDASIQTSVLLKLIFCFIKINRKDDIPTLVDEVLARSPERPEDFKFYINIGRAYYDTENFKHASVFAECLIKTEAFKHDPDGWLLYGLSQQALAAKDPSKAQQLYDMAARAFERVLELQPDSVDAKLNLSTIVLNRGKVNEALEILKDFDFKDLDSCNQLPDERLLINQAEILYKQGDVEQYIRCIRMLLIPYFYDVHQDLANPKKLRKQYVSVLNNSLRKASFDAVRGSSLEKMVKRLGSRARSIKAIDGPHLHDYAFRLVETLFNLGRYQEMLHIVCYAYNQSKIIALNNENFQNLLFFAAIHGENYSLAFEFLRYFYFHTTEKEELQAEKKSIRLARIFNAMNFVFCHQQNVSYHRFIMRALVKSPDCFALHIISGNNSLVTGSYRHALGEYLHVWLANREDPLSCLLVALTFTHMACKKDISSRHMLAIRSIAFMYRYQKLRGDHPQEIAYNIGRMFHQLGILSNAIFFYERVLRETETPIVGEPDERTGDVILKSAEKYDLRRVAAHNLALIYESSGNRPLAREILEEFCSI
uniref:Uncharacterized protein n=1 Tax=Acrobeloides nanus TaxID=290746 RepID=A0A914CE15_9BILA